MGDVTGLGPPSAVPARVDAPGGAVAPETGHAPTGDAWAPDFGSPSVASGVVAVAVSGDEVYIGGDFTFGLAGTANDTYRRIAHWDGRAWRRMLDGVDGTVRAILTVGTDTYVGGDFTVAGGATAAHLARWDGTAWSAVAGGVSWPDRPSDATVRALASDGSTLFVGGAFSRAGAVEVRSIAALDLGTETWSDAGGGVGLSWSRDPGTVHALTVADDAVLVGGAFDVAGDVGASGFARLDPATATWTAPGGGVTDDGFAGTVNAIAVDHRTGEIVVGGRFTHAGAVQAWNLAVLRDGRFASLGDVRAHGGAFATVSTVAVVGDHLHVGGEFTGVGNAEVSNWARHDGRTWAQPGAGVDGVVRALAASADGGVVVAGDFTASGPLRIVHAATWTGSAWRTFGQGVTADPYGGGAVHAIVPGDAGAAVVAGLFDQAGSRPVGSIARWTGTQWDDLAGGVTAAHTHGQVSAMLRVGDDLYVGGRFDTAGGRVVSNIARWDGRAWSPLGDGLDGPAYALAQHDGWLYVGGGFGRAGSAAASRIARWDLARGVWSPVGNAPGYDDDVRALAVVGGRWLVIGGDFHRFIVGNRVVVDEIGGLALFDTARELDADPLAGYHHLPGTRRFGGNGIVSALQVIGDDVYVGGWFDVAGVLTSGPEPRPGFPTRNLAVWHVTPNRWESVPGTDAQIHALAEFGGRLAVGGQFTTAGDVAAGRVALLDPATGAWRPLDDGLSDGAGGFSSALTLAPTRDAGLWVGGQFPVAGTVPSANLARWTETTGDG